MPFTRRLLLGSALTASAAAPRARADETAVLRLGVLTDLSGPYRDVSGPGSVACTAQAAQEAMAQLPGLRVEVLQADHQNKPDIGAGLARQWFDRDGVDAIVDVPHSGVGLAVAQVAREKDRVFLITGAATTDLTGAHCAPTTVHWTFDTFMLSRSNAGALVAAGRKTWFFIIADYAFGHALQRDATAVIEQAGGRVVGAVAYPFPNTSDFSAFLLQAKASGAQVVAFANAGADAINCVKQAREFGLGGGGPVTLAAMLMFIADVHSLGTATAQGLTLTESFYWDRDDRTRAFAARVAPRMPADWRPDMEHAGAYAATLHYLKVAHAMGVVEARKSGAATVARMKATPTDDDAFGPGRIREDGRKLHPAYLFRVKSPQESRGGWDLYELLATTPANEAARPLDRKACKMLGSAPM
jgi:branched-chain amino acid transport system substrate-binding protein